MNYKSILILLIVCLAVSGCSNAPETVQVTGKVAINGQPAEGIRVQFVPNSSEENVKTSIGETDAAGRFELVYQLPDGEFPGAAIGSHSVVLEDMMVNDLRTADVDQIRYSRIENSYSDLATTPLQRDVEAGKPAEFTFDIK